MMIGFEQHIQIPWNSCEVWRTAPSNFREERTSEKLRYTIHVSQLNKYLTKCDEEEKPKAERAIPRTK